MKKRLAVILTLAAALCALAVPATASAQSDTTDVTGDVPVVLEVSVPEALTISLTPGQTNTTDPANAVIASNVDWTLKVEDTKTEDTAGYMVVDTNVLDNAMIVKHDATEVDLSTEDGILATGTEHGEAVTVPFTLSQEVTWDDPVAAGYSIILTFAVSPTV